MEHIKKHTEPVKKFKEFLKNKEINILDIFDIDNIPMSELDKAYIDYEPLYDTVDLYSLDEDYVYEEKWNDTEEIQSDVDYGKDYIYTESDIPLSAIREREDKSY